MASWGKVFGTSRTAPVDIVERFVSRGLLRSSRETAELSARDTVTGWVRELVRADDQQVMVHRPWGTVAAVAERRHPATVVLSDGVDSWFATGPEAATTQPLTPDEVEHVVLDSLTASDRPSWPYWHLLTEGTRGSPLRAGGGRTPSG